jgi:hypothetical protein
MNKKINISNEIIEEQQEKDKKNFKKERDKYLKKYKNCDIEPEYLFNSVTNIIQLQDLECFNKLLEEENSLLKKKIEELEQKLKKYTNGDNHKRYYEKNKDKIKINGLSYLKNLKIENPEKIKEYNHNAYMKKKEKQKLLKEKVEQVSNPDIEQVSNPDIDSLTGIETPEGIEAIVMI